MGGAVLYIGTGGNPCCIEYEGPLYADIESSACWLAGETPDIGLGEFQLLAVAGDVAGDSSLFRLRLALGRGGAAIGSMPPECFLR